jgi:hypothetical protein
MTCFAGFGVVRFEFKDFNAVLDGWRGIRPPGHSAPRVSPDPEYRLSSFTSLRKAPHRPDLVPSQFA